MGKFTKGGKKEVPQVSTSSLPDIVYMLIFFFMITTTMRDIEPMVLTELPKASEVSKLEKKALVCSIYIGPHVDKKRGDAPLIQLNDQFAEPADIPDWYLREKESRSEEDKNKLTVALKVDKKTHMGIVTDVKQELRRASAFRINYTSDPIQMSE